MKKLLSFLILLLSVATPAAAEGVNALVIHMKTGKQVICMLDDKPIVSFGNNELILATNTEAISYNASDVVRFTYTYVIPQDIKDISRSNSLIAFEGNSLNVTNVSPGSEVSVCTTDGILVGSAKADEKGDVSMHLSTQSGQIYVVKTSVADFKIRKQ